MRVEALIPILVFISVLLTVNVVYLFITSQRSNRRQMSRRLSTTQVEDQGGRDSLMQIRRGRSLTADGNYALPFVSLNQLILQSGVTVGVHGILFTMALLFVGGFIVSLLLQGNVMLSLAIGAFLGTGMPLFMLKTIRDKRRRRFEEQLPEGIDVLVRGLKAGHAIPAAIASVGSQMPEPIGGEFSITASELTYGLDFETAMSNLRTRVGQADLSLIVLAVSIQARMGGNLAEILANLSKVLRERFKLRRKAKALSAEGRYSAVLLSILPVALFGILWLISPGYYGQVLEEPIVKPVLTGAVVWMLIGDFMMYRMVKLSV
ncbi:MAG: type II secretion system F family protein [Alphaproteobacteria bacterium]